MLSLFVAIFIESMKIKKIGTLVTSAIVGGLLLSTPATAVILVEPIVTTPDPNLRPQPIGIGLNPPRQIVVWNAPDVSGQQNFLNDTGLNLTTLSLLLFPDFDILPDDVVWGDVNGDGKIGISNLFTNFDVDNNFLLGENRAPLINITGGIIPNGERFVFQFLTNPNLTLSPEVGDNGPLFVGGAYNGVPATSVPEPSNIFAFVLSGGIVCLIRKSRSLSKKC
jgi:hypothetical protein